MAYKVQVNLVKISEGKTDIIRQAETSYSVNKENVVSDYECARALLDAEAKPFYDFLYVLDPDRTSTRVEK